MSIKRQKRIALFMNEAPEPTQCNTTASQAEESALVVIVGAGPTGLAAGNLLGMSGIATLIFERNDGLSNIPKAIALDDEGLRICQAMGLSTAISNYIVSDISVHCVSEGQLLAKVIPTSKRNGYPLISTFYQPEFEAVLLDGLRRFSCVNVRFQHTVETVEQNADCVFASIRTPAGTLQKVRCAYLLACDGGGSTIRRSLNIPLQGRTFAQRWLVIDAISKCTGAHLLDKKFDDPELLRTQANQRALYGYQEVVKIFCNPQRPAVSIPAPHDGRRWEFMLLPGETDREMLEPATISALLQQTDPSPNTLIIRQTVYTFHAARAKTFSQGRVFLLGDAAHMMPPFGGQGLNSGLRDAHNLAWKLAMVLQDRAGEDGYKDTCSPDRVPCLGGVYLSPRHISGRPASGTHKGPSTHLPSPCHYIWPGPPPRSCVHRAVAWGWGVLQHVVARGGAGWCGALVGARYEAVPKSAGERGSRYTSLLATYHQERSRHAAQMVAFASFLGTIFMSTVRPLAFCRNLLIQILYALPITRQYLMEMRMKPQAKYKAGFFLFKGQHKSMVGSLLPQPEVITQQGQRVLLDEVLGPGFALLRCHSDPAEAFATLKTDFWQRLGARFVCVQTDEVQSSRKWKDAKKDGGSLPIVVVRSMDKDFLCESQDHFIVVRPDRFILGIFKEDEADAFVRAFQRLLHGLMHTKETHLDGPFT